MKKILLVPDQPGWAFDYRAKDLISSINTISFDLKYKYEVTEADFEKYQLIYAMSLDIAKKLNGNGIPQQYIAVGITSLRQLDKYRNETGFNKEFLDYLKKFRGLNTSSKEIKNLLGASNCEVNFTRVGIDESLFKPSNKTYIGPNLRVGWVGRIDNEKFREHKGFDIVLDAIRELDICFDYRTYKEKYVPREKMIQFYQNLDLFICSSKSEHIPLPVLEAASCGVPIISTNVGIVPEIIIPFKNGLIVERTIESIHDAIKYLIDNPDKRKQLSVNIRKSIIHDWTLSKCIKNWEDFFYSMI